MKTRKQNRSADHLPKKSCNSGFTFVELMIVLVIIGLSAITTSAYLLSWTPNLRLKSSANDIYGLIQKAKLQAIKRGSCVAVKTKTYSASNARGTVEVFLSSDCSATSDSLSFSAVESNVSLKKIDINGTETTGGGVDTFYFEPTSVVHDSETVTITLETDSGERGYTITVTPAGAVTNERS